MTSEKKVKVFTGWDLWKKEGEWAKQIAIFCCLLALSSEGNFTAINSFQSYPGICWESDWFAMYFWVVLKEHKRYSLLCKRTLPWLSRKTYKNYIYWYLWQTDLCIWQFRIAVREANVLKPCESNHMNHSFLFGRVLFVPHFPLLIGTIWMLDLTTVL